MRTLVEEVPVKNTRTVADLKNSTAIRFIVSLIVILLVSTGCGEIAFAQSFSQQFSFNQRVGVRIVPGQKLHFQLIAGAIPVPIPATEVQYEVNLDGEFALQSLFAQASFANAIATAAYDAGQVHPGKVLMTSIRWNVADGQLTIDAGAPTVSLSALVRYRLCNTSIGACTPWTTEQVSVGTCDVHITIPNSSIPSFGKKQVSDEILLFYVPLEIPGIGGIDFGVDAEALFSLANQRIQDANRSLDSIPLTPSPGSGWTSDGTTVDFQAPIKSQAAIGSQLKFHMDFAYLADLEVELKTKSVFVGISVGLPCVGASYERKVDVDFHLLTQNLTRFWSMSISPWDYGNITVINHNPTAPTCTIIQPFKKNRPGQIQVIADDPDNANFGQEEIQYTLDWRDQTQPDRKSVIAGTPFAADHMYAQAGDYSVQLTAEDHHGAHSQATCNINVGLGLAPGLLSASLNPSIVKYGKRWAAGTATASVTFRDDDSDDYVSLIQLFITPAGGQRRLVASVMNNNPDEPNGVNLSYVWNTKTDADKVGSFDIEACAQDKLDAQMRCTSLVPEPNPVWVDNEPPVASMEQPANGQTVQVNTVTPEVQARAFDAHGVGTQGVDFEYAEYNGSSCGSFSAGTFQSTGGDGLIYKALFYAPSNNKQYCVRVMARDFLNNVGAWSAPPAILDVQAKPVTLSGRVVYKTDRNLGINGAAVTATAGFKQSTTSGPTVKGDGFYSLLLPKGTYTACAEQGGAKDCKTVTLDASKGQDFELALPIPTTPPAEKVKLSVSAVALVRQGVFVISVPINVLVQVNGAPLTTPAAVQLDKNKPVLLVVTQTRITLSEKRYKFDHWECDGKPIMATTVMFTLTKDTGCTGIYVEELG